VCASAEASSLSPFSLLFSSKQRAGHNQRTVQKDALTHPAQMRIPTLGRNGDDPESLSVLRSVATMEQMRDGVMLHGGDTSSVFMRLRSGRCLMAGRRRYRGARYVWLEHPLTLAWRLSYSSSHSSAQRGWIYDPRIIADALSDEAGADERRRHPSARMGAGSDKVEVVIARMTIVRAEISQL
jgi:hypothetical protein